MVPVFWRSRLAIAAVVTLGFLIMLGLVLFIVDRRRPAIFRLKATFTRWVSLSILRCARPRPTTGARLDAAVSATRPSHSSERRREGNLYGIPDLL